MDSELRRLRKRRAILDRAIRVLERLHELGCPEIADTNLIVLEKTAELAPGFSNSKARVVPWYRPRKS